LTITCRDETTTGLNDLPKALPRGDYVRISVADTGEGMSETTLAKAMEPFFTTKGIGKGTGLGLSMVHGLTAQSGGAMHISSQLGKGTVVTLWLPRARQEDVPQMPASQMPPAAEIASRKLRVLLVDDDSLVSMNTAYMLMDLGHSVLEAPSAAHALQLLETDAQFDVVVTDFAMPGMNGLDLATRIRRLRPRLPVVLATGYAELPPHAMLEFPRVGKTLHPRGIGRGSRDGAQRAPLGRCGAELSQNSPLLIAQRKFALRRLRGRTCRGPLTPLGLGRRLGLLRRSRGYRRAARASLRLIDGRVAGQAKCTQSCGLFSHGVPFRLIFRHGLLAFA
jgi:CheY-like chemotaxis protein